MPRRPRRKSPTLAAGDEAPDEENDDGAESRSPAPSRGLGGVLGNLGGLLGGAIAGSVLSGGLRDLIERFRQNGQGEAADSWVSRGPNQPVAPDQLEQAIGPDVLNTLSQQTGLSRQELKLTRELPEAVDKFTPEGRLPTEDEAARLIGPADRSSTADNARTTRPR